MHPLAMELVRDPLDGDLHFRYLRVMEGLGVVSKRLLRGNVLEEHQDAFHAVGGHVEIEVPGCVALVFADFFVSQYTIIQDRKAAASDHSGQIWLSDHVKLQTDVLTAV